MATLQIATDTINTATGHPVTDTDMIRAEDTEGAMGAPTPTHTGSEGAMGEQALTVLPRVTELLPLVEEVAMEVPGGEVAVDSEAEEGSKVTSGPSEAEEDLPPKEDVGDFKSAAEIWKTLMSNLIEDAIPFASEFFVREYLCINLFYIVVTLSHI